MHMHTWTEPPEDKTKSNARDLMGLFAMVWKSLTKARARLFAMHMRASFRSPCTWYFDNATRTVGRGGWSGGVELGGVG